ncbi:MAG: universal stress protein [Saprospiraceae bacterium]
MKTIIACTDFSHNATNAVQYAAALARATEARLVLFHYFDYPLPATDLPMSFPTVFVDELAEGLTKKLKEIQEDLAKIYPIKIDCVVRSYELASDLKAVYEAENASLVVMGMHGQSAVANALFGSVSTSAIRQGKLPLLIVPMGVVFHPVKKILFPFDDHPISYPETIKVLRDLALDFDAYIEVFTMFDLQKTPNLVPKGDFSVEKSNLETMLSGTRHGFSYENEVSVNQGILYEAARSGADMVAMIPHHHSFLSNLLNLSKTQRIAVSITLPLLVLAEKIKTTG